MSIDFTPAGLVVALVVMAVVGISYVLFIRRELR